MIKQYQDRTSWLAARQPAIGASESGAALGLSPWESPYSLWVRKMKLVHEKDISSEPCVEWGNRLEPYVVEAFGEHTGREVRHNDSYTVAVSDNEEWLSATLDAVQFARDDEQELAELGPGALEIKTTGEWAFKNCWEDGKPPLFTQVQLQQQMHCSKLKWGSIAVLVAGQKFYWHTERYNPSFWDQALPRLGEFWRCVLEGEQPEIDGHKATTEMLAKLYPESNGEVVALPSGFTQVCRQLAEAKAARKEADEQVRALENRIKSAMGEAEVGACGEFLVRYPTIQRKGYTVESTEYRRLTIKEV